MLKKKKISSFSWIGEEDDAVDAVLAPYVAMRKTRGNASIRLLKEGFAAALGQLPERYRNVMVMRYTDNLKFREIAERLHEPIDTVKSRHRRGLVLLRSIVGDGGLAASN